MADFKFYLKQPTASELLDKLVSVVQEVNPNCFITNYHINTNAGQLILHSAHGSPHKVAHSFKTTVEFKNAFSFLQARPFLDITDLYLDTNDNFKFSTRFGACFIIVLGTSGPRENDAKLIAPISDALHKHFNLMRPDDVSESLLPDSERSALQTARTILLDFSSQAARLAQLSAANTERLNETIIRKTEELDALYAKKTKDLEEAYSSKNKDLGDREEAFRKEKATFDARENTVVRRDLLKVIERILGDQKEIKITRSTIKKRTPIHLLCITTMAAALALAAAFAFKLFRDNSPHWANVIPIYTGLVLFVTTAIFYMRWNDLWFKEHANAEFENRKFYLDVVRASWIAELLFEWKEKKEVPFPDRLIVSYATGLFEGTDIIKAARHPLDDLRSIIGSVSEVRLSKDGEVSLKKDAEKEK